MPANNKKMEIYVLETVNRLHLIQVDFADESEQTRMDYLCEEIERALKTVLPEERNEFLQRLQERFPIGNGSRCNAILRKKIESSASNYWANNER